MDWGDLHEELLSLVLSNLLPKDRKTFGLVCRSWNAIATTSLYRFPWLMTYQESKRMWKFIQPIDVIYINFPNLYNAKICCSKYGWLLMSRDNFTLFFFDPFNTMTIELPKIDDCYTTISFFHPPTSPRCFIFSIADLDLTSTTLQIRILKRGEDKWTNKWTSYTCDNKFPFLASICTPVLHRGFVYCLDVDGNIGTFNINGQFSQRSWMVYTKLLSPPRFYHVIKQNFLFKIHGKKTIFAVFVEHGEGKVNVLRLLEPEMKWELVEDLGDKMLFVSRFATFAETTPLKSMANRIYFPMFHGDKAVFYSLVTRKYHSFVGDYAKNTYHGFKELRFATWMMPLPTQELREELTP